jgi:surfactin synthase thioesterase subunit
VSGAARPVLFCLPHAGGSAAVAYRTWGQALGDVARVVPLELAGRGRRSAEACYGSLRDAAADCTARVLAEAAGGPFALFGHSMGGLLAYEVDACLRRGGDAGAAALVLAGTPPPNRPRRLPVAHSWSDERFLDAMRRLGGLPPELLADRDAAAFYLALLRADQRIYERHRLGSPAHRVCAPMLVLLGAEDPVSFPHDGLHWRELAGGPVTVRTIAAAGHFFPSSHRDDTLLTLREFLLRVLPAATTAAA